MITIGITGGTGTGKTHIVKALLDQFNETNCNIISQDSYYKETSQLSNTEKEAINFDHPDAIDFDLLYNQIVDLQNNKSILQPSYSFITHNRTNTTTKIIPKKILIIEGILILSDKKIQDLCTTCFYIDTDDDIRLLRRVKRDLKERGRSIEEISNRYIKDVKPMHEKFVVPVKRIADYVINNNEFSNNAIKKLYAIITSEIKKDET